MNSNDIMPIDRNDLEEETQDQEELVENKQDLKT